MADVPNIQNYQAGSWIQQVRGNAPWNQLAQSPKDPTINNSDAANGDISSYIQGTKFTHLQTEYQVFPEEYFSGADCTIYFGDTFIDDITGLEFTLQEQIRPLFGYADFAWSDVARGNRLVQGTFRIAFKEAGYLFAVLDHLAQLGNAAQPALSYLMTKQNIPDWHASARQTIEDALDYYYGDSGRATSSPVYSDYSTNQTFFFDWPEMGMGASDSAAPYSASNSAKSAGYTGSVKMLQAFLLGNGFGIPSASAQGIDTNSFVGLKQRYEDGDSWPPHPASGNVFHINGATYGTNEFYGVNGTWPNGGRPSRPLGSDVYSTADANLEKRLYLYQVLQDQNLRMADHGDGSGVDGKFGDLVRHGVAVFQMFAGYAPGANPAGGEQEWVQSSQSSGWGGWVDQHTADLLSLGTTQSGTYDIATKTAVYAFQKKYQGPVTGPSGESGYVSPTGIVDKATIWRMSQTWNTQSVQNHVYVGTTTASTSRSGNPTSQKDTFEERVKQYEQEIWGRMLTTDSHNNRTFFYDGGSYIDGNTPIMPKLKKTGFDMYITYGPIGVWALQNVDSSNKSTYNGNIPNQQNAPFANTVHAVRNVQLASLGQVLNADGNPIEEVYAFIARDMD